MIHVLVAIHLMAAAVWFGGSTALVFVAVPAIRAVTGEPRATALRQLGLRWRPLGYGSLLVAALTGVALAARDWNDGGGAFHWVLWVKVVAAVALVSASYVHNFVLGPRLQAEIRDGLEERSRRPLVIVGWVSYGCTLTVPLLGVALQQLVS